MELYLSMININMNKISNQTNTVMKRLTLITTIFMPLNLIAGILGMSEFSMMFGPDNWKLSYPVLFLFMCCLGYLNYIFLKWKKWV
jgi:magnesium transporter